MKLVLKLIAATLLTILLFSVLLITSLNFNVFWQKAYLPLLNHFTPYQVQADQIKLNVVQGLTLGNLAVNNKENKELLSLPQANLQYSFADLFKLKFDSNQFILKDLDFFIDNQDGQWSLGRKGKKTNNIKINNQAKVSFPFDFQTLEAKGKLDLNHFIGDGILIKPKRISHATADYDLTKTGSDLDLRNLALTVTQDEKKIADLTASGKSIPGKDSSVQVSSKVINIDSLLSYLPKTEDKKKKAAKPFCATIKDLLLLEADLKLNDVIYNQVTFERVFGELNSNKSAIKIDKLSTKLGSSDLTGEATLNKSNCQLLTKANLKDFALSRISPFISYQPADIENAGRIDQLDLNLSMNIGKPGQYDFDNSKLKVSDAESEVLDLQVNGTLDLKNETNLTLTSDNVELQRFLNVINNISPAKTAAGSPEQTESAEKNPICATLKDLPKFAVDADLKNFSYKPYTFDRLAGKINSNGDTLDFKNLSAVVNNVPLDLSLDHIKETCAITGNINAEQIPLNAIIRLFDPNLEKEVGPENHGIIDAMAFDIKANLKNPADSLDGRIKFTAKDVWLPSKVQNYFPFNIIFLPFKVLLTAFEKIGATLLPGAIGDVIENLNKALSETGRLEISDAQIDIVTKDREVIIKTLKINPNLLPRLEFAGKVGYDKSLDITIVIKLLNLQLRLPVAGTTSFPVPNIVKLVPEIIKGLGLSFIPDFLLSSDEPEEKEDTLQELQDEIVEEVIAEPVS